MARFAIIDAGRVTNIAEAEEGFGASQGWIPAGSASIGDVWDGEMFTPGPPSPLPARQAAAWERIKAERDRRTAGGVKVGANWFHSDSASRIQQIALVMLGANIPPGLQWKVLTLTPPPVFVTMTQTLASQVFGASVASDAAIFAAAETHRVAMEASATPESYDCTGGWPASIEDAP